MADTDTAPVHVATLPSSDAHEPAKAWTAQWAGPEVDKPVAYPSNEHNPDTRFGTHELPDPAVAVAAGFPPQPIPEHLVVEGHITQSPLGESPLVPAPHLAEDAQGVPNRAPEAAVTDKDVVAASAARDPMAASQAPLKDPRPTKSNTRASQGPPSSS